MDNITRDRFLAEVRHVTINRVEWDQTIWAKFKGLRPSACGSVGCLAGNTVIHEGINLKWYVGAWAFENPDAWSPTAYAFEKIQNANRGNKSIPKDEWSGPIYEGRLVTSLEGWIIPKGVVPVWYTDQTEDGRAIEDVATEILGLIEFQEEEDEKYGDGEFPRVFDGENDLDDLWEYAIQYTKNLDNPITYEDKAQAFAEYEATQRGASN